MLPWGNFRKYFASHVAAWVDQAIVSAASFGALVMLGRATDSSQLGVYVVTISMLALVIAIQESLITRPYSIQFARLSGIPAAHAFSILVLSLLLSAATVGLLCTAALALSAIGANSNVTAVAWGLASTVPFVLMREFARRFALAHLKLPHVLAIDSAVAAFHLGLLCLLSWTAHLSALAALFSFGISCAIGGLGWLYAARREFGFRFDQLRTTLAACWNL